jgi:hypothetical protein
LKTESYEFIGNNVKSYIDKSEYTRAVTAENLEKLVDFCGDAQYLLLGHLNKEIEISASQKSEGSSLAYS